ncbi:hypothetical protein IE81DRAFT_45057 [Ceraceosorus guamensis]|uniref:Cyclin C-terminal domain-containing protein n=1 Tax=Ceraceosorus guamensis TaxID=1522189 RepID=A0A316W2C7_9BASI|nr:hypothetical protein IE81DRAFT_45057 [Ceraceosorus guamensis]PWN44047.1 hypothetical protein IE81DRAFT_45057 [Ceraceosorus guamensis]
MPSPHPAANGHSESQSVAGPSDLSRAARASHEDERPRPIYTQTSQYRHWNMSPSALAEQKEKEWHASRKRVQESWEREMGLAGTLPEEVRLRAPEVWPDAAELDTMVRFYLGKLRGLVGVFGLPDLVEETASTYLKRFFVKRCALEWSVKDIMLTCLYLSLKSTSHTVPLSYFATKIAGKAPGKDAVKEMEQTIRGLEFGVADAIGWELSVHGPGRALRGLVYDMQSLQPSPLSTLHALLPRAQSLLWSARLTDLELLYPPSQIALACLMGSASSSSANAQTEQQDEAAKLVNRWLQDKYERGEREHQRRQEEYQKIQAKASSNKEGSNSALADTGSSEASDAPKAPFDQTIEELQSSLRKILGVIVAQEALSKEMSMPASAEEDESATGGKAPSRELVEVKRIDALLKASADPAKRPGSAR